jgi:hypothetical protein
MVVFSGFLCFGQRSIPKKTFFFVKLLCESPGTRAHVNLGTSVVIHTSANEFAIARAQSMFAQANLA